VSETQPILIAVDDMQRCDERSASLLAALAAQLKRRKMLLVLSAESGAAGAVRVLAEHCHEIELQALCRDQSE